MKEQIEQEMARLDALVDLSKSMYKILSVMDSKQEYGRARIYICNRFQIEFPYKKNPAINDITK